VGESRRTATNRAHRTSPRRSENSRVPAHDRRRGFDQQVGRRRPARRHSRLGDGRLCLKLTITYGLDNAAAEAFNSTLKVEFVHRQHFRTRAEARIRISTWIVDFYNTSRRHSANGGLAPIPFEHQVAEPRTSAAQLRADVA
jgi:transposase InsO family protein